MIAAVWITLTYYVDICKGGYQKMAVPMFDPKEITEAKKVTFGNRTQTIFNYPCSQR